MVVKQSEKDKRMAIKHIKKILIRLGRLVKSAYT